MLLNTVYSVVTKGSGLLRPHIFSQLLWLVKTCHSNKSYRHLVLLNNIQSPLRVLPQWFSAPCTSVAFLTLQPAQCVEESSSPAAPCSSRRGLDHRPHCLTQNGLKRYLNFNLLPFSVVISSGFSGPSNPVSAKLAVLSSRPSPAFICALQPPS